METNIKTETTMKTGSHPDVRRRGIMIALAILAIFCAFLTIGIALYTNLARPATLTKCVYNGKDKEGTFASDDGCNTCICGSNGEVACTLRACAPKDDTDSDDSAETPAPTPSPTPNPAPNPAPPASTNPNVPGDYLIKASEACQVKYGVPPQNAKYNKANGDTTYKWNSGQFEGTYPSIFSTRINVNRPLYMNSNNEILGNDNPATQINIECGVNSSNLNLDSFGQALEASLGTVMDYNVTKDGGTITKWGLTVQPVKVTGGFAGGDLDYLVIKGNLIYRVRKNVSPNADENQVLDAIFDNLVFL